MRVLITGASSGIGLAACKLLRCSGHDTCGISRRPCPEASRSLSVDLSVPASPELLAAIAWADAVVFAAGKGQNQLLALETEEQIEQLIQLDLTQQLLLLRHCGRLWMRRRHGHVLFVTSVAARTGMSGLVAYAAAKAGLEAASRAAARELGRFSIQVNCIAPGFVETPMTATMPDSRRKQLVRRTPLGRLGQPNEVAGLILSVLTTQWVTGQTFVIDGGFSA